MNNINYITASEIGEYVYCGRAWWLRRQIIVGPTPQMVRGSNFHNALAYKIIWSTKLKIIALLLIAISILTITLIASSITKQ